MKNIINCFLFVFIIFQLSFADGLLKVNGKKIINENNEEILLRGMGIGGWMLPEGYMLHTSNFANPYWEMKQKIKEFVGEQNAEIFWNEYQKNFVTRLDIEKIKELGFNSIRLAMHYEFFINYKLGGYEWSEKGFLMVDSLLKQCADNKIYLILDLHAAPGGQSANGISDYNPMYASLWDDERNKTMTIELWRALAKRYKNEKWIGGYDILNEPAWNLGTNNIPLKNLYLNITNAIRSEDSNHIIFIEGNWYATDFSGLTPPWDKNMVYSFHKYWNSNDDGAIRNYLNLRDNFNIPLWNGESGENSNVWFTDCIKLMEDYNIGWSWWTLKKFETIAGPFSVPINAEYRNLLNYLGGQGSKPTVQNAMAGLMGMANGLKLENIIYHPDVIDAMFRQVGTNILKPFKQNKIPGIIFASDFDLGKHLFAYKDEEFQNLGSGGWNNGNEYRNDGVDIEKCNDTKTNGFNVGWISNLEFLHFTINAQSSGVYSIDLRFSANSDGGTIGLSIDGETQIIKQLPKTGGWQNWETIRISDVNLTQGEHKIKLNFYFGGFNVNYLEFKNTSSNLNDNIIPKKNHLGQNYPNPFNSRTNIKYMLQNDSFVKLDIYNIYGQKVLNLVDNFEKAGFKEKNIQLNNESGVYFYRLTYNDLENKKKTFSQTNKMILIK